MSILFAAICFLLFAVALVSGFAPSPPHQSPSRRSVLRQASSSSDTDTVNALLFPVLRRISGIEWTGPCRYVGADLEFVKDLKLFGGIRYDVADDVCTLSSFLTFPNDKTREVVMTGTIPQPGASSSSTTLRLNAVDGNGPIYMVLTELAPDTILINEVDSASGNIVLTASISLVTTMVAGRVVNELVQVSHEVGDTNNSGGDGGSKNKNIIEGHQVWRLKANTGAPNKDSDYDVLRLDTTGR
jgi:hypothetical protein